MPVDRPVHVAVPANLTEGVPEAVLPNPLTNDGLVGYAESSKCRVILANCKLERIETLQPAGARRAAKWCKRQVEVCKAAVP